VPFRGGLNERNSVISLQTARENVGKWIRVRHASTSGKSEGGSKRGASSAILVGVSGRFILFRSVHHFGEVFKAHPNDVSLWAARNFQTEERLRARATP
jgi:hypothetical protein